MQASPSLTHFCGSLLPTGTMAISLHASTRLAYLALALSCLSVSPNESLNYLDFQGLSDL